MNPVFSTDDRTIIRSAYRARDIVIFDPCEVVFQAQVSAIPSATDGTYLQIAYDTVSEGAYTDIRIGQMVLISETDDHTDYLYEMRVAGTPTASILPVNESADVLALDYYITVINTYKPLPRVRAGTMVDGRVSYQAQSGAINNLPSAMVVESSTTGQFVLNPSIQRLDGSTVSSILYEIPGAVYDVGGTTTLASTVTMPADSHTWGRLSYVLSSGATEYMVFQLIVLAPDLFSSMATLTIDQLTLNRTWQGHHATCRAFAGVTITQVMNGTRAVIVSRRKYKGGALDGEMPNVSFVGYLSKENNSTQSRNDKSARFDLVSIWERAGQLPFNPIAVRDVASPTTWDEINLPTPQNVTTHILARYSTILNLCSLNLDVTDSTWYGGDMDFNASSLGDAIEQTLSEINAVVIQNPSGELFLRRDLRFEDDTVRDAADSVWTLTEADLKALDVTVNHDKKTGRVIIGFRGYQTSRAPSKGGKAVAPAVILGTSPETQTRNNQLMPADLSDADLLAAARVRDGNLLAAENPPFDMSGTTRGNLSWLNTSCHQWVTISLPPSVTTRGVALSVRALLASVEIRYLNREGDHDLNIELLPETKGGGALIVAALSPNVSGLSMFILPPMPAYPGNYGGPSTLNGENQRFNRQNMGGMGVPIPPDQSYEDAQYAPEAGKKKFAISFAVGTPVAAGFTSTIGAIYRITVSGSAQIEVSVYSDDDFTTGDHGWTAGASFGATRDGGGWKTGLLMALLYYRACAIETTFGGDVNVTKVDVAYTRTPGTTVGFTSDAHVIEDGATSLWQLDYESAPPDPLSITGAWTVDGLYIRLYAGIGAGVDPGGEVRITRVIVYDDAPSTQADAFWEYKLGTGDEEGEEVDIAYLGVTRGLLINGSAVAVPPDYNPSHTYTFEWTGDGTNPTFVFADTNYGDNTNRLLYITIEGEGVDS